MKLRVWGHDISYALEKMVTAEVSSMWNLALQSLKMVYLHFHNAYDH